MKYLILALLVACPVHAKQKSSNCWSSHESPVQWCHAEKDRDFKDDQRKCFVKNSFGSELPDPAKFEVCLEDYGWSKSNVSK